MVMGTPDYLAPEQALDPRQADARTDLYGLGCTLYFLLTGEPPFAMGTLAQKLMAHQQTEPPAIKNRRPEVPPAVADILRRMLAKKPDERPASALEVAVQLAPFAAALPGHIAAAPAANRGEGLPGTEVMPPTLPPRSAPSGSPASRSILTGETIAPPASSAPLSGPATSTKDLVPAGLAGSLARLPRWWPLAAAAVAGAGLLLMVLLVVLVASRFWGNGDSERPAPKGPIANGGKGEHPPVKGNGGPGNEQPGIKVDPPVILDPLGKNEAPDPAAAPVAIDPVLQKAASGDKVFLSDLKEFAYKGNEAGWAFGKDGRMGGPFNERPPIFVSGKHYTKGLHTHPRALGEYTRVCYALGKQVSSLHGAVGLVEGAKDKMPKPTRFVIYADGKLRWRSKTLNQYGASEEFHLDVRKIDVLELRAYLVDGLDIDTEPVWMDPYVIVGQHAAPVAPPKGAGKKVVKVNEGPPSLEPKAPKETVDVRVMPNIAPDAKLAVLKGGDKVFLSDLKEFAVFTTPNNWQFAKEGRSGDPMDADSRITVNGMAYPKGLGMHPPNMNFIRVCYALGKRAKSLHGGVALDDGKPDWPIKTAFFVVIGDGRVLWRSEGIKDTGVIERFEVDVRGVAVLELRVYSDYEGANGCRAAWLDPYVVAAGIP
jgi:hypothetical protein